MATRLQEIPLSKIRENPVALRTVNRESEEYLGLVDSIRKNGVLCSISVREIKDADTGETLYGLVDGLHRFSASTDAGLDTIPAQVMEYDDAQTLQIQIIGNIHKIETKPVEYSKQLLRMLAANPTLTLSELASQLSKTDSWLTDRLGLTKLSEDIGKLVDEDKLNLTNAYALSRLPEEEQVNFLDRALTMSPAEFAPTASARLKEIKDAARKGREAAPAEFVAVPHVRKVGELKDELTNPTIGAVLVKELKVHDPAHAFALGVAWALHMDPKSVEAAKAKDVQRKAAATEAKAARERERLQKQQKEAADKAAHIAEQLATGKKPELAGATA